MSALRRTRSTSGSIPFLWEHLPGISKVVHVQTNTSSSSPNPTLPPPPCSSGSPSPLARRIIYVPLPPCPFASTQEFSSAQRGMKKMDDLDDPFLAAFMECTKCNKKEDKKKRKSVKEKVMEMRGFSCKYGVGVRKDAMVRVHDGKKYMEVKED